MVLKTHDAWSRRISTATLNSWLKDLLVAHPVPRHAGKAINVKYMTQVKARPPTFAIFCNHQDIPGFFERFLRSKIQKDFKMEGVPLRFVVRKSTGHEVKKQLLKQGKQSRRGVGHNEARGVGPRRRAFGFKKKGSESNLDQSRRNESYSFDIADALPRRQNSQTETSSSDSSSDSSYSFSSSDSNSNSSSFGSLSMSSKTTALFDSSDSSSLMGTQAAHTGGARLRLVKKAKTTRGGSGDGNSGTVELRETRSRVRQRGQRGTKSRRLKKKRNLEESKRRELLFRRRINASMRQQTSQEGTSGKAGGVRSSTNGNRASSAQTTGKQAPLKTSSFKKESTAGKSARGRISRVTERKSAGDRRSDSNSKRKAASTKKTEAKSGHVKQSFKAKKDARRRRDTRLRRKRAPTKKS